MTDSERGGTQRMTLPLIHLIEADDTMGGLRRAARPARETSMARPNSRLHVSFVVWLLVRPQMRLRTESRLGLEAVRSGLSPWRAVAR